MKTIFFSGSRSINSLPSLVKERICHNILTTDFQLVVGDANGADKAFQQLFMENHYPNVEIYCSGDSFRNNLGNWQVNFVPSNKTGRAFYTEKDKKMAQVADYGFVLWDGESIGSLNNIAELLEQQKSSLIFYKPTQSFITVKHIDDLLPLIDDNLTDEILKSGNAFLKESLSSQYVLI